MSIMLEAPLDLRNFEKRADRNEIRQFLTSLQGNILKSHARKHAAYIVVTFPTDEDPQKLRKLIAQHARDVRNAEQERLQYEDQKKKFKDLHDRIYGGFASLMLSASGYRKLGVPDWAIPGDPYFRAGMRNANGLYHVPVTDAWEKVFRQGAANGAGADTDKEGGPDALLLLATDLLSLADVKAYKKKAPDRFEEEALDAGMDMKKESQFKLLQLEDKIKEAKDLCKKHKIKCQTFRGQRLRRKFGVGRNSVEYWVEHFGFRDDISQPKFVVTDSDQERAAENAKKGIETRWDERAPLDLVLVEEPWNRGSFGSYVAFQKIRQFPKKFKTKGSKKIFGRKEDGTPLVTSGGGERRFGLNNFAFDQDRDKNPKCPFHAHMRKMNPRGDTGFYNPLDGGEELERDLRIARRGIPYTGENLHQDLPEPAILKDRVTDDEDVGLLFMSYQSQLINFVFLNWAARYGDFVKEGAGLDQILSDFTELNGGEYFFAPSLPFLQNLDNPGAIPIA